jgi:hypothetical protein
MNYLAALTGGSGKVNRHEDKKTVYMPSSEADADGKHLCLSCSTKFKCLGVKNNMPKWCCRCKEQDFGSSGIKFWCSYECERKYYDEDYPSYAA